MEYNIVIENLVQQVARASKESAINYALAVELQAKVKELEEEVEKLKGNQSE